MCIRDRLSALLTGLCFRHYQTGPAGPRNVTRSSPFHTVSFSSALVESVRSACSGMLSVCAFVLFFYVLARPLSSLPFPLGPALVGATELFSLTPLLTADRFGFVLSAAASGWGGLSVLCQTAAVLELSLIHIWDTSTMLISSTMTASASSGSFSVFWKVT